MNNPGSKATSRHLPVKFALTQPSVYLYYYYSMALLVAILFEEKIEESYIAVQLDGSEPEILFAKGPAFTKRMGPFPVPYAQATFDRWQYCVVENPPVVQINDPQSLISAMLHIHRQTGRTACYVPDTA